MEGWIKLHRKILNWDWWNEPKVLRIFLYLIIVAQTQPRRCKGFTIDRGQIWMSERQIAANLGISYQEVRTALKKLKTTQEIETKITHLKTLITICNYESYQLNEREEQRKKNAAIKQEEAQPKSKSNAEENAAIKQEETQPKSILKDSESSIYKENLEKTDSNFSQNISLNLTSINNNKNNKENNMIISSSPARAHVCERVKVGDISEWLRNAGMEWKETMCMQLRISMNELTDLFDDFQRELICQGEEDKEEKDIKKHFANMARIILNKRRNNGTDRKPGSKEERDAQFAQHIAAKIANATATVESGDLGEVW